MIPYDDLVIALATWRARQGLPVAQLPGTLTPPPAPAPAAPAQGPRTAPPSAPPGRAAPPAAPQKQAASLVDDSALLDEAQYDGEGDDFAMTFASSEPGESTSIGVAPPPRGPVAVDDDVPPPPPRRGGQSW